MGRRHRILRPDEAALWSGVARSVRPLAGRPEAAETETASVAGAEKSRNREPVRADRRAPAAAGTPARPTAFDRRQYRRLSRGRSAIDSTLDLHGMTRPAAHRRLIAHLGAAVERGDRCVLVITGKGGRRHLQMTAMPAEFRRRRDFDQDAGVLRRSLPDWLESPPLSDIVQSYAPAHLRHGGEGALYVMLRRLRQRG